MADNTNTNQFDPMDPYQQFDPQTTDATQVTTDPVYDMPVPSSFEQPTDPYAAPDAFTPNNDMFTNNEVIDPYAPAPVTSDGMYTDNYDTNPVVETVAPASSTFEEKKSGNKLLLYAVIALIVILAVAAGVLFALNNQPKQDDPTQDNTSIVSNNESSNSNEEESNTDNTNTSEPEEEAEDTTSTAFDSSTTGGPESLATKARIFNATKLPKDWILQNFTAPDRDSQGTCLNINRCGENADPLSSGMTNIEKYNFGLDPLLADFDTDGIADGDEVYVYNLNPKLADNDADTFTDSVEITQCFNPGLTETTKMTNVVLTKIAQNISLRSLHEPTITTLTKAGATTQDLASRGVVSVNCPAGSFTSTPTAPTTRPTTNTPATTPSTTNSAGN